MSAAHSRYCTKCHKHLDRCRCDSAQVGMFDATASAAARDEAVERVESNADPAWMEEAFRAVVAVCRVYDEFTTDDVWLELETGKQKSHEPRAMGA